MNQNELTLWKAIADGNLDEVKKLIAQFEASDQKAKLTFVNEEHRNILHHALMGKHGAIAEYILTVLTKPGNEYTCKWIMSELDKQGKTPLHYAQENNLYPLSRLIIHTEQK